MEIDDAIARCLAGDKGAYEVIVATYADRLVALISKLVGNTEDARDIAQEAFVRAYIHLDKYDPRRPWEPWLYRIARNLAYNHLKMRGRRLDASVIGEGEIRIESIKSETKTPEDGVLENEKRSEIDKVLLRMRPEFREILTLRYMEHMEYEEIADAVGIPVGTVKTWLNRAKSMFRKLAVGSDIF